MADKELGSLASATTLDGTETHYVVQGGNSRKTTGAAIVAITHNQAWSTITSTPTTLSGYGITDAQPLDSDLTAIAALTTTGFGRGFLEFADEAAFKAGVNLEIGIDVQAHDALLDAIAALTTASGDIVYATGADAVAALGIGVSGQVLKVGATGLPEWGAAAGGGDMLASVYDPNGVSSDAFDMANMVEATDAKIMTAAERTKLAGIEAGADVTDATNVDAAGATMNTDTDVSANSWVLDEDDMASDSATKVPTQQSVNVAKLQKVADRTALLALDTAIHTGVYVLGMAATLEWDGSDLSGTVLNADVVSTAVDSTTDTITSAGHGLRTCDAVLVSSAVNGLSANTLYYVIYSDDDNFQLAASRANALAGTAVDLTGTSAVTVNEHRDPDQNVYVTPSAALDGSTGAWVAKVAESKRRGWANSVPPANIRRLGDRILVGRGATDWNGLLKLSGGAGSWLFGEGEGTQQMHYLLVNAAIAGVSDNFDGKDSPYGVFGAARTPSGDSSQGAIGITGYAKGDATSGASVAWAGYLDAVKGADSNTTTEGLEIEVTNLNPTPAAYRTPYSTYAQGRTYGLVIGAGADETVHPVSYDADTALVIFDNGAKFRNGLVIDYTALTEDVTTGYQHAILLANNQRIEWHFGAVESNIGFAMHSAVSDNAHATRLVADDNGVHLYSVGGSVLWEVGYAASAVNGLRITPAATGVSPIIAPKGGDTNVGLDIDVKGTGLGRIRGGDGLAKVRWSSTGVGFLGAAEQPRATVSGSRGANAALASLLTALANFGLITDSSTA